MYFVDRKKIEETLLYMEECLVLFKAQPSWQTKIEQLALERLGQGLIEGIIDVGNSIIDGFIMRDPGSYEDIIDILFDEKVITEQEMEQLKKVIMYRKKLVQSYTAIHREELYSIIKESFHEIEAFPKQVRRYLEEELGPVSAFLPHQS